jgi:hypothetical protein
MGTLELALSSTSCFVPLLLDPGKLFLPFLK